jgi:hypothetical protein
MHQASDTEYRKLNDPEFLAERARVRGLLERTPEQSAGRAPLAVLYAGMTAEFDHRAGQAWAGRHEGR